IDAITEKRRRRRESHNAVERRRRDNINEKIQELATLLPDFASDSQNKPNKGVILRRSVDYIRQIQGFATMQVDRNREIENALRNLLERTGVSESELGLSMPL
ncbi:helix-loop-helix DNA-binding domain-containing protein, partial [Phlyctochytrium arcticum]